MLGVENKRTKRVRPIKRWIDLTEDMRKRGFVRQDAGNRHDWWIAAKGLANPQLAGKIRQDNKGMLLIYVWNV